MASKVAANNHESWNGIYICNRNNKWCKDKFLSEIVRIMNKYPWCDGVDIDLERGGGYEIKMLRTFV